MREVTLEQYFHVGIIVPDLLAARTHLSDLLGTEWGPVMDNEIAVRDADGGELTLPNRICYSTSPPHIELILETPGTPWVCNEHSNLHHIGFFSGTLDRRRDRSRRGRMPARDHGGPWQWTTQRLGLPP